MRRLFTPTLRITAGLVLFMISLILIAYSFGLVPNEDEAALKARAQVSEALQHVPTGVNRDSQSSPEVEV